MRKLLAGIMCLVPLVGFCMYNSQTSNHQHQNFSHHSQYSQNNFIWVNNNYLESYCVDNIQSQILNTNNNFKYAIFRCPYNDQEIIVEAFNDGKNVTILNLGTFKIGVYEKMQRDVIKGLEKK